MKIKRNTDDRRIPIAFAALAAVALALLIGLGGILHGDAGIFDRHILLALRQPGDLATPIGPGWLKTALEDFTALGDTAVVTLIVVGSCGYLLAARNRAVAIQLAATVALGAALETLIKTLAHRPRPDLVPHLAHFSTFSFPSGHAFNSTVAFLTLGVLLARAETQRRARGYILTIAALIPLTIGFSRVYLGVHWPSDVLAGWCFGALWAWICLSVGDAFSNRRA